MKCTLVILTLKLLGFQKQQKRRSCIEVRYTALPRISTHLSLILNRAKGVSGLFRFALSW